MINSKEFYSEDALESNAFELSEEDRNHLLAELGNLRPQGNDTEWEKFIMYAGDLQRAGVDMIDQITPDDARHLTSYLKQQRTTLAVGTNEWPIYVARVMDRLNLLKVPYQPINSKERQQLEAIPDSFRQNPANHEFILYLPQLARTLGKETSEIVTPEDEQLALQAVIEKLKKGGEEELRMMCFAGILGELDQTLIRQLINRPEWHEDRMPEALEFVNQEKRQGRWYSVGRVLPHLKQLIEIKAK